MTENDGRTPPHLAAAKGDTDILCRPAMIRAPRVWAKVRESNMVNIIAPGLLILMLLLTTMSCGDSPSKSQSQSQSASRPQMERAPTPLPKILLDNDNWDLVISEAKGAQEAYLGSNVDVRGIVTQVISTSASESQIAIKTKREHSIGEYTVVVVKTNPRVTLDQWVRVQGILHRYWTTEHNLGSELRLPIVAAQKVSVITRAEAIPAIRTVNVDQSISHHGLTITLQKLEIAESETRLYIHAINNSSDKASLYAYDVVLVQGTQQVKMKSELGQEADEPDSTLVSGTETQGVLLFEPASPDSSPVRLVWEGPRTDDYSLTFDDWEWEISW